MSRPWSRPTAAAGAAQPGEAVESSALPRPTQQLLTSLALTGREHLSEVAADLCQTNTLLREAIIKLTGSFTEIHQTVMAQQALLAQLPTASAAAASNAQFDRLAQQLAHHIGDAVTGLQFQDLTSQLIERTLTRLAGLQHMLAALDAAGAGMSTAQLQAQLERHNSELSGALQKSVGQKHMESGDIELF